MRFIVPLLLSACATTTPQVLPSAGQLPPQPCFDDLVMRLAADSMEGRGIGTQGLEASADLLAHRFAEMGLQPGGDSFDQRFEVVTGVAVGQPSTLLWDSSQTALATDWTPVGFSSNGTFDAPVVFAGYGVRAEPLGYDDFAGVDVAGKVVLAMRFEPQEDNDDSVFEGRRATHYSDLRRKALSARELGAAALIIVTPAREDGEPDPLLPMRERGPVSRAGLPVLHITRELANAWLAKAGTSLEAERAAIDAELQPRSKLLDVRVRGEVTVDATTASVRNIVGVLPGAGSLADEVVVVGAHYDHLGHGGSGSMTPDVDAVHNGADDNASGVAAMICGVETMDRSAADRRTLVVAAFTAEEIGLAGSSYYTEHPVRPLDKTVAMVNLDMVGQLWAGPLQALGTDSAPEWTSVLQPTADTLGITLNTGGDGYGPSDHMSFYEEDIPVVHFFTGSHPRYHTPADDVHTVDMAGGQRVSALLSGTLGALATRSEGLSFQPSTSGPVMAGDSRGFNAYLGTIPDYSAMTSSEGGVLLSGVRAGGPADLAGIRGDDTLVHLGTTTINNLYDFVYALRDHRPGDTVKAVVLRDGERIELQATLGKRGESPSGPHGGTAFIPQAGIDAKDLLDPRETHLADLRQLTFGGENAEAYFSPDGRSVIFQRTSADGGCDQQFIMDLTSGSTTRVSSGLGRTTCGYFTWPGGDEILYATTESGSESCPPPPDRSQGYVWPLYPTFDIVQHPVGGTPKPILSVPNAYDAEATVCMADGRIVFTSTRDGDLELYTADADGSNITRITNTPGYDGGAFFTKDCSAIVYRASRPEGEALADYQRLLTMDLVRPGKLELYRMNPDGTGVVQLTNNGAANFGPYPLNDNSGVVFSSNVGGSGREFDLHHVGWDGGEVERITFTEGFDGFPMFSPDGRHLIFASNRATAEGRSDTNLFIATWVP